MSRFTIFALVLVGLVAVGIFAVSELGFDEKFKELILPLSHEDIIRQEAGDEDIAHTSEGDIVLPETSPALLAAVINQESGFRDQTSHAGARGLMQITPDTADTIEALSGGETFVFDDLANPELNIRYGSYYLRYLLYSYDGNVVSALAAYNAGPGNADAWGGSEMDVEDIEFPETLSYVEGVLEKREQYQSKYAAELGL